MGTAMIDAKTFCQVGLVVRDIEKSAREWAQLFGVAAPPVMITDTVDKAHTNYRGKPSEARAKLAFLQIGSISLELIEPVGGPSTWKEFLDAKGEGVHHIAFNVTDAEKTTAQLTSGGMPMVQRGDYTGGCYTYIESEKKLGVILELLQKK